MVWEGGNDPNPIAQLPPAQSAAAPIAKQGANKAQGGQDRGGAVVADVPGVAPGSGRGGKKVGAEARGAANKGRGAGSKGGKGSGAAGQRGIMSFLAKK